MHGCAWWAGSAAIAISLCTLPSGAVGMSRMVQFAQNASDAGRGATEPSQPPVAEAAAAQPANLSEQIRKA
jgi:hypothetical protein